MNIYIKSQIDNMILLAKNFEQSCTMAANQDDGMISRDEEKKLKKIKAATERFMNDLEKMKK